MSDQSITVCPACGAANGAGSRFCGACGGRLDDAVALYADPSEPSLTPPPEPIAVLPPSGPMPTPIPTPAPAPAPAPSPVGAAGLGPAAAVTGPAVAAAPPGSGRGLRYALIGVGALIVVLAAVLATVLVARKDPSETAQPTAAAPVAETTAPAKPRPKAVILQGPPGAVVEGQPLPVTVLASPTDAVTATVLRIDDTEVARSNGFAAQLAWPTAAINPFAFTRKATVELTLEGGDTLQSQPIEVTVSAKTLGAPVDPAVYDTLKKFGDSWAGGVQAARALAPNSVANHDPSGYANIREYVIIPVRVVSSTGTSTRVRAGVVVHEEGVPPSNTSGLPAGYVGKYTRQYCMTIDVFPALGQVDTDNSADVRLLGDSVDWLDPKAAEPAMLSAC